VDINGAKALRQRLGPNCVDEASASVDVPADAPPVYRWVGVTQSEPQVPSVDADEPIAPSASLFRRLGLSFR